MIESSHLANAVFVVLGALALACQPGEAGDEEDGGSTSAQSGTAGETGEADCLPDIVIEAEKDPGDGDGHGDDGLDESSSCMLELSATAAGPPAPEQIPDVVWTVDGEPIPYLEPDACESGDGWTWWVDEDFSPGEILLLCGQACEDVNDTAELAGYYGCDPRP